jgi:hypothetical protein
MTTMPSSSSPGPPPDQKDQEGPSLTDQIREIVTEEEWATIGPAVARLERNRWIKRRYSELREDGAHVAGACQEITQDLPYDFSASAVKSIIYGQR